MSRACASAGVIGVAVCLAEVFTSTAADGTHVTTLSHGKRTTSGRPWHPGLLWKSSDASAQVILAGRMRSPIARLKAVKWHLNCPIAALGELAYALFCLLEAEPRRTESSLRHGPQVSA